MADDDTQTTAPPPPPSAPPATNSGLDLNAIMQRLMQQPTLPQPDTTPVTRGLLSRLGEALGGGQTTGVMSPAQQEVAGLRALQHFGTSLIAGSGYHPGQPALGAFATGFEGAAQSERGSEQGAAATLAAQQQYAGGQQQQYLERLKMALPLLQMQAGANLPNPLLAGPAVPGTAAGAGKPGGGGVAGPLTAYGKGGPAANVPVPDEYMPLFQAASKRTGVPVDLLIAQARQESGFNPGATGGAGEVGIMQIHPKTATDPGFGLTGVRSPDILRDPATNINFGADYLAARAKATGADLNTPEGQAKALQAYNGGGDPNYVANVTRYMPAAPQATAGATQPPAPYKVATSGNAVPGPPSGSATAPAATSPAPGQPPAAPTTTADATQPATPAKLTFEQFRAQNQIDPASLMPDLAGAKAAQAAAAQQLSLARAGRGGDPNKSLSDYNTATDAVNRLQQEANAKVLDAQRQLYDADQQRQAQAAIETQKIQAAAAEAERQRQAAIALKTQEGQQAIELAKVNSGQTFHQKLEEQSAQYAQDNTIKPMAAQAAKAHQMNLGLSQLLPVLQDLPKGGGALGVVLDAHPDLAPLFNTAGILTDRSADAVRLVNGLVSNISTEMKPTGLGALREYEWDAFKAQLPSLLSTPGGQQKAVAMLMNMNNRIQEEGNWMNKYFTRKVPDETTPGATRPAHNLETEGALSAQQQMDKELGPVIPSYTGPMSGAGQAQWEQALPPGKPYYKTWAVPDPKNPGQPLRDQSGNVRTTKTLEVRPWQ